MGDLQNKIKLVFLTDCLADLEGGAERQIYELAKRLDKTRFQIFIVSLESEGQAPQAIFQTIGCQVRIFPIKRIYGISGIREGIRFWNFLRSEKIYILQTYHFSSDIWGTVVGRLARVRVIISNRRDIGFWRNCWHITAYRLINPWVNQIITNSQAGKDMVVQTEGVADGKIDIIYNGVEFLENNDRTSDLKLKAQLNIAGDELAIMHVANLKLVKGHDILLKAFAQVVRKNSKVKLVLIGEDKLKGVLQDLCATHNLTEHVLFLGKRMDTRRLLTVADICVLPSLSEGMSNAILEYMAAGKPVVATSVGGNPELIEHGRNGLLVEKEDINALKEALLTLIENSAMRQELGKNNLTKTRMQFSMERMVASYESLFNGFFNRPKHILHFISSAGLFGAENVVLTLARNFNKNGMTTIIAALDDARNPHTEIVTQANKEKIPAITIRSNGRWDLGVIFRLKKHLIYSNIGLLHTHNYKSNLLGLLAAKLVGIPVVSTAHGFTGMTRAVSFYESLDRFILRFFDRVVVVTEGVLRRFPPLKKRLIKNGLDIAKFSNAKSQRMDIRKKFGISEGDIVIGTVGRLSKEKNQKLLLNAAKELVKKHNHLKFLIVGTGPEEKHLKLLAVDRKLSANVIFAGFLTNMPDVYQAMDIFCLPSLTEGVPLTVLEAMASKVPVVATWVGGDPGLFVDGKTGLLVESENVESLVVKLSDLTTDAQKRTELSSNAFSFVSENFSQEKMVENYRRVYEELLGC